MRRLNVYEAVQRRLEYIFNYFEYVYVSFSGGKDSGLLLHLCIDYIRKHEPGRKLGVFHMDYEVQYKETTDYVARMLSDNRDILEVYHCCVPFKVSTATSMHQSYWRPWDPELKESWVRDMPDNCMTANDFDFYTPELWDYDFQFLFESWLIRQKNCRRICSLVGIRAQESFNRWRTVHSEKNYRHLNHLKWTHKFDTKSYNAYPLHDWKATDIWTAYGKFGWDYNRLYDLYYQAGVPINRQRVASPFISQAIHALALYKAIDPDMWGRMISRVNGVNFAGLYGKTKAMGWKKITCPKGFSWKEYMFFLLDTLPEQTRRNYLNKLQVSIRFWRERGGCLADETIEKLKKLGVNITVGEYSNYRTDKKPVRMEYLDDIDIAEFQEIPTYKRMCICILKNDHTCRYMGFSLTKQEKDRRDMVMKKYKSLKNERTV